MAARTARFSPLKDINVGDVDRLAEVCRLRVSGPGPFSSGLVVVDGILYLAAQNATVAVDPTNCYVRWKSVYTPKGQEVLTTNRGVAVGGGEVVRGTSDGHLLAYDARSGELRWDVTIGDGKLGEFVSSAPLIWGGKVYVGLSGGDWGIRGRVMAYDLSTGQELWRFYTVPSPGHYGANTWSGESWKHGGGGTWTSYTLDPATGELFVPVANPSPDFNGPAREGDNLFTDCVLVLDAKSGKYLWHYQTLKHDTHDYGVTSPPALITLSDGRKAVAVATKGGYLYLIDRRTHGLIYSAPITTIEKADVVPTTAGVHVCPGIFGGNEWNGPGVDPAAHLLVVGAVDWCGTLKRSALIYTPGQVYFGGDAKQDDKSAGWLTAFDDATGKIKWRFKAGAPVVAGVTPTAGGVTFAGDLGGELYAFRTSDGRVLNKLDTGGAIAGGVITYKALGTEYLAVTSGNISRATWPNATGIPSLVIYKIGELGQQSARQEAAATSKQSAAQLAEFTGDPGRGSQVFSSSCSGCHGAAGEGGVGPRLRGISSRRTLQGTINFIENPEPPMPRLYPSVLTAQNIADVASYIRTLK